MNHNDGLMARDTFKFHLKKGGQTVHRGITTNLLQSESDLQSEFPGTRIKQVGRQTTREAAQKWLREGGKRRYRRL